MTAAKFKINDPVTWSGHRGRMYHVTAVIHSKSCRPAQYQIRECDKFGKPILSTTIANETELSRWNGQL